MSRECVSAAVSASRDREFYIAPAAAWQVPHHRIIKCRSASYQLSYPSLDDTLADTLDDVILRQYVLNSWIREGIRLADRALR